MTDKRKYLPYPEYGKTESGYFYLGACSKPLKITDGVYQMRCYKRRTETSKYFDIVTVQLEVNEKTPIEEFETTWVKKCETLVDIQKSIPLEFYVIHDYLSPQELALPKYNQDMWLRVVRKLCKYKPLTRRVKGKE